jgi:hypothetical protein
VDGGKIPREVGKSLRLLVNRKGGRQKVRPFHFRVVGLPIEGKRGTKGDALRPNLKRQKKYENI